MKTIKSIQNLSVSELLSELYELESDSYIAYIDLYNHFRANTNNFDPIYVALLIRDMIEYVPKIEFCWDGDIVTLHDLYFNETLLKKYDLNPNDFIYGIGLFDLYRELQECCLEIDSSDDYENGNEQLSYVQFGSHYIEQYARMVDEKAQELNIMYEGVSLDELTGKYYYRGEEVSFDVEEKEIIQPHLKRPQNTHNQQYSILERTGVIDYLKNKYKGITDVALAKLIANILNRDPQNTRVKLSLTGTKNQVSNEMKNDNFIKKMFAQIGL